MEVEKFEGLIHNLDKALRLNGVDNVNTTSIREALFILIGDKNDFDWLGLLPEIDITFEEALRLLLQFDFNSLNQEIETPTDIFPAEILISYKVRIKARGIIWKIHAYDHDPFPSSPHAHQLENNIKLDLSTGKCFKVRRHIHSISKKELLEIREKAEKVYKGKLPPLTI